MREELSKNEINSLLEAIDKGNIPTMDKEPNKDKIRPYDFRRPFKLSREYVDTLYMMFENFAKLASMSLSNQILTGVNVELKAIEQISFDEFLNSVEPTTIMGLFRSKPLIGSQIISMSPSLCIKAIELMCGGLNSSIFNVEDKESFTDIEISIIEEIFLTTLKSYESIWNDISMVETELYNIDSNLQAIQVISPNEPVILISLDVEIEDKVGVIIFCIPYLSLDNIMDKLSFQNRFSHNERNIDKYYEQIRKHIANVPVNIEVSLGKSIITVEDILGLDAGDIIELDMGINESLGMYVENLEYFKVNPGQIDGNLAVEVVNYIEGDDGIHE